MNGPLSRRYGTPASYQSKYRYRRQESEENCRYGLRGATFSRLQPNCPRCSAPAFPSTGEEYRVEIHKKNSIPVAAIVFVLIGSALGILVRRSGASIGIGMSIGFFTLYYLFLIGGETMGDRMLLPAWLAMWLPNIILGPAGIILFIYAARR